MKCPFMSKMIIDGESKFSSKAGDYYVESVPGIMDCGKTNFDSDKKLELYNITDGNDGHTVLDTYMLYHDCIEDKCQLWDDDNSRCGALVSNTIKQPTNEVGTLIQYFESVLGKPSERDASSSLVSYLKNILGLSTEKNSAEGTGSSLLREVNHIHGAHYHCVKHDCPTIPTTCGIYLNCQGNGPAGMLMNEFTSNADMDGNGKIYGIDFIIKDDENKPPNLIAIENNPEWVTPPTVVEWQDYADWFENPDIYPDPLA